jgi:hypothetical protein
VPAEGMELAGGGVTTTGGTGPGSSLELGAFDWATVDVFPPHARKRNVASSPAPQEARLIIRCCRIALIALHVSNGV